MIAFKGVTEDLGARLGSGDQHFKIGRKYTAESSKTAREGFHCCENPFKCLTYYSLNGKNRFFMVEAAGSIDEDNSERIACTEITLLKELSALEFALEGMKYMINHQERENWQCHYREAKVLSDMAEAEEMNHIAIARGENPCVRGPEGSILGIIRQQEGIGIIDAKLFVVEAQQADKWLKLGKNREVMEVCDEKTVS